MRIAIALVLLISIAGCDKQAALPNSLVTAQDKALSLDERLQASERYCDMISKIDQAGRSRLVDPLQTIIADKASWAYTPRIATLISKMGRYAEPLRADLLKKQDSSPNSQSRRWQDCIDAINGN